MEEEAVGPSISLLEKGVVVVRATDTGSTIGGVAAAPVATFLCGGPESGVGVVCGIVGGSFGGWIGGSTGGTIGGAIESGIKKVIGFL